MQLRHDRLEAAAAPPPPAAAGALPPRTSDVLAALAAGHGGARVTVADIVEALGGRAFGALLFVFAAPNLPPLGIPGISSVCALPLIVLALQLMAGRTAPALPRWLLSRSMPAASFARAVGFVLPWLARIERLLRPRAAGLTGPAGVRVAGLFTLLLALVLILPIPLGNLLPAAAVALLGLALSERDGIAAALGYAVGLASLAVVAGVLVASAEAARWAWEMLF
jgi:hypothetical protein